MDEITIETIVKRGNLAKTEEVIQTAGDSENSTMKEEFRKSDGSEAEQVAQIILDSNEEENIAKIKNNFSKSGINIVGSVDSRGNQDARDNENIEDITSDVDVCALKSQSSSETIPTSFSGGLKDKTSRQASSREIDTYSIVIRENMAGMGELSSNYSPLGEYMPVAQVYQSGNTLPKQKQVFSQRSYFTMSECGNFSVSALDLNYLPWQNNDKYSTIGFSDLPLVEFRRGKYEGNWNLTFSQELSPRSELEYESRMNLSNFAEALQVFTPDLEERDADESVAFNSQIYLKSSKYIYLDIYLIFFTSCLLCGISISNYNHLNDLFLATSLLAILFLIIFSCNILVTESNLKNKDKIFHFINSITIFTTIAIILTFTLGVFQKFWLKNN
ncbi:hypothetical protein CWI38_0112p0010 [Hamiltosporidium tvaerminnensis]|uniref:Uncharacterized protein n=1 Tax=Hamiltosporidium tvaerminnensis TaxID=1176355 RepID=A0A4Q9LRV0_9MICR|nr:hypothetical protein CWI38_1787p0010 [Hamiltosporidium tvaerminnensis]TBU20206.1 hypothetical protein CWI38_0112p0010 [Hamiltosporidium tvaerminnensis]